MPANTVYLCDGCGKNLSTTEHLVDYRLKLISEIITIIIPKDNLSRIPCPLATDAYFCGWACLDKWLEKRRESNG